MPLYLNYPSFIHPEVFPGIKFLGLIRWYGLMYVFAFGTAYLVLRKQCKEGLLDSPGYKATEDDVYSFLFTGILWLLIGARVFATLVYDGTSFYWKHPWLIFWPFRNGHFTGLAGMSYHGGYIGGFLGMIYWCKRHKQPVIKWIDAMGTAIPLGYTFGRLGNFLNGELFGRITTSPIGMVFPSAEKFSTSLPWVQDFCKEIGMNIEGLSMVNLPRHPSQLYEALFEGLLLFAILWFTRKRKKFDGVQTAIYTGGYGLVRFVIEYFRQPDEQLGYRIASSKDAPIYKVTSLFDFSTGQVLCFLMIVFALTVFFVSFAKYKKSKQ